MFPLCHHHILWKISKSDEKLGLLFRGGSEGPVAQAWCQGPVRRLGRRRWADSATDGRTGLGGPATPAKRPSEPEARGRPGAGGGGEASSPPEAASWALPPGPGPTEPPRGCGFLRPPRRGARARWPAQRRKRKGTVIATPRLLSSLGEGRRIPALNQLSDRGKIVELLICENRLIMLYVFAYPA